MRIHCDGCGRELESDLAIRRTWDGGLYAFCSEACARASRHLSDDVAAGDDDTSAAPETAGDLDEPAESQRPRRL